MWCAMILNLLFGYYIVKTDNFITLYKNVKNSLVDKVVFEIRL